jgi:hypothetical protein
MAVKAGMIGMAFTNARPSIAPTFSVQPMLGTNPIAFGAPTDEDCPFLYDAATSITQRGKFEVLAREGKPAKPGWAINEKNETITDAEQVLQGFAKDAAALLPRVQRVRPGDDCRNIKRFVAAGEIPVGSFRHQPGRQNPTQLPGSFLYGNSGGSLLFPG